MKATKLFSVLAVAMATLAPLSASAQSAKVSSAKRLPPEVFGYLSVPSVTEFKARMNKSEFGTMLSDASMDAMREEFKRVWGQYSGMVQQRVGLSVDELLQIPSGEVSIAAVMPPRGKLGVAVFMDVTGSEDKVNDLLDKADEALEAQGVEAETEEIGDTEVFIYQRGDGNKLAYFMEDEQLVISSDIAILESVLSRWDGDSNRTFADSETYKKIMDRCGADKQTPMAAWYINPIDAMMKAAQSGQAGQAAMFMGFLPALGVMNFKAVGGTMDMGIDDFESVSRTMFYVDQPVDGVLKAFLLEAKEYNPPKYIPADATGFMQTKWRVQDAFEAVQGLVDSFQGPGALEQLIDNAASDENGPMIHIKKDVIDQLTGEVTMYSKSSEDIQQSPTLFALGVKENEAMADVFAKLAETPGAPVDTREFKGAQIYEIPNPAGGENSFGITVAGNAIWFTTDVRMIEKVLRADPDDESLSTSAAYKKIAGYFPDNAAAIMFTNQEKQMETIYNLLRDGELGSMIPNADRISDVIDFGKLPAFDAVRKYFKPTGSYIIGEENGVFMEGFGPK